MHTLKSLENVLSVYFRKFTPSDGSIHMNSVLFQIEKLVHGMASPMVSFFHPDVFLFAQELGVNVKLVD